MNTQESTVQIDFAKPPSPAAIEFATRLGAQMKGMRTEDALKALVLAQCSLAVSMAADPLQVLEDSALVAREIMRLMLRQSQAGGGESVQ